MNFLIIGGSSGLGAGVAEGLPSPGDTVWVVSRSRPAVLDLDDGISRQWIPADLRIRNWINGVRDSIGEAPVDMLFHSAGIWESNEDLLSVSLHEFSEILDVNTSSLLEAASALSVNLMTAARGWIIAVASTAGLENATGPRAAYAASKFGVRGAIHGLREAFREKGVGVCCISAGALASDVLYSAGAEEALRVHQGKRIPTQDFIAILRMVLALSPATCIKEIDLPAQADLDV